MKAWHFAELAAFSLSEIGVTIQMHTRVRVKSDRFREEGAPTGTVGYVIEAYADGTYEVEVSDANGVTVAQFVASEAELEVAE